MTMTVSDLIKLLRAAPDDAPCFLAGRHDYQRPEPVRTVQFEDGAVFISYETLAPWAIEAAHTWGDTTFQSTPEETG